MVEKDSNTSKSSLSEKRVVLAVEQDDERQAFTELFGTMQLQLRTASSASEVMQTLEDFPADLLILDVQLDMHAWQIINKIKELDRAGSMSIMVLTNQDHADLGMTITGVEYLTRPVSIPRLRQHILNMLAMGY